MKLWVTGRNIFLSFQPEKVKHVQGLCPQGDLEHCLGLTKECATELLNFTQKEGQRSILKVNKKSEGA
jgi:hypothetical protein